MPNGRKTGKGRSDEAGQRIQRPACLESGPQETNGLHDRLHKRYAGNYESFRKIRNFFVQTCKIRPLAMMPISAKALERENPPKKPFDSSVIPRLALVAIFGDT